MDFNSDHVIDDVT